MKSKTTLPVLITDPHGAQSLRYTESRAARANQPISNQLFTLGELLPREGAGVTMTGEEIDSLCEQWKAFRNASCGMGSN
jgi:hypothetical protein